jgi:hypothetical protein
VGYEFLDPWYQRMGSVKELLVNAGKELEYIRVRVGLLGLKSVLIPVRSGFSDTKRAGIRLSFCAW